MNGQEAGMIDHSPQLDGISGTFGITSAMSEGLLRSHAGEIHLLPGVDLARWRDGSFRGLRALGGFEVGATWKDGTLVETTVLAKYSGVVRLRCAVAVSSVTTGGGTPVAFEIDANGGVQFETVVGTMYVVQFQCK
jgi:alpha-L-fucosidase 2